MFRILSSRKKNNDLINYIKISNDEGYIFEGNTIMVNDDKVFHIENIKDVFFIEKINKPPVVYTNHGINIKTAGYTNGKKGVSSFIRKKIG